MLDGSEWPVTPAPVDLKLSSGLCGYLHTHRQTDTHACVCMSSFKRRLETVLIG